jgi:hypothetical protein
MVNMKRHRYFFLFLNFLILYFNNKITSIQIFIDMLLIVNSGKSHSNFRKREYTHWHLKNEYFIAVNHFATDITSDLWPLYCLSYDLQLLIIPLVS